MNLVEAQAALDAADKRVQDVSRRREAQFATVRDLERQLAGVTSTTSQEAAGVIATNLNAARTILVACDNEVTVARRAHEASGEALRQLRGRVAELAHQILVVEANTKTLKRDLIAAEHRVKLINDGLATDQRAIAQLKKAHAALTVDFQPA